MPHFLQRKAKSEDYSTHRVSNLRPPRLGQSCYNHCPPLESKVVLETQKVFLIMLVHVRVEQGHGKEPVTGVTRGYVRLLDGTSLMKARIFRHQRDVTVTTGSLGVVEYSNSKKVMTPIYLMNLTSQLYIPVPKYMWTLLHNQGRTCQIFTIISQIQVTRCIEK